MTLRIGSLFSGAGALDLAIKEVLNAELRWVSDIIARDKHGRQIGDAPRILTHRWPDAPNHGDITRIDWATVEPVTILTGGWPCQPWSRAGKQKGTADDRALWPEVARAFRVLRPALVVLENVSAIIRAGELARAVTDLAACGYRVAWVCLRAADVGAPHGRDRTFLAAADPERFPRLIRTGLRESEPGRIGWGRPAHDRGEAGALALLPTPSAGNFNASEDPEQWEARRQRVKANNGNGVGMPLGIAVQLLPTPRATDGTKGGPNQRGSSGDLMLPSAVNAVDWGKYAAAISRWETLTRPAPAPTVPNRNGHPRLNPEFSEWMMGWPAGWVTNVPGMRDPWKHHAIGNGVVPQQAAAAIRWCLTAIDRYRMGAAA